MRTEVLHGDCRGELAALPPDSFDSVCTDPPYELGFMGRAWDRTGVAFDPETWAAVLRVLKPGGYMLAMGGTRTYHRLACAVEDAGFEIRDCLMWMYGTGFPKGQGCLKPAWEPILLARKPGPRVLPLGIDACRVPTDAPRPVLVRDAGRLKGNTFRGGEDGSLCGSKAVGDTLEGRWPANVLHDGSDEVLEAFAAFGERQGSPAKPWNRNAGAANRGTLNASDDGSLDRQTVATGYGDTGTAARFFFQASEDAEEWLARNLRLSRADIAEPSSYLPNGAVASALSDAVTAALPAGMLCRANFPALSTAATPSELKRLSESAIEAIQNIAQRFWRGLPPERNFLTRNRVAYAVQYEPTGTTTITASRWKSDGCADIATFSIMPANSEHGEAASLRFNYCAKASKSERGEGNTHPTVKPLALMRWMVRLVTPEGGRVLDPFAGSGSTLVAALLEGREAVGAELDAGHCEIIKRRLAEHADTGLFAGV